MTEAAALQWRSWGIGDHYGGADRGRRAQGFDNDNGGVHWGSRRYNASEWTSLTAEAPVRLRDQGIDNNNSGIGRVRRARGLSNDIGGVGRGRGIYNPYEGLETTAEAAVARRWSWEICDDDGGVVEGRWAQRLQQQQRMHQRRIDDTYKGSERTSDAAVDWQQARWIGNNNGVLIFLSIGFLTVTLPCICLLAVSFWYCFYNIPFFPCLLQEILSVLQSCGK